LISNISAFSLLGEEEVDEVLAATVVGFERKRRARTPFEFCTQRFLDREGGRRAFVTLTTPFFKDLGERCSCNSEAV
jgi:hypothetical protein